jgi:two-component system nitrogen regulation response regulator NtrX
VRRELSRRTGRGSEEPTEQLYAQSPAMRAVTSQIAQALTRRGGVLVRGEAGCGRQVVARAIHAADPNSCTGSFVAVDCAAFDADALGMELFGVASRPDEDDLPARTLERISARSRIYEALGGTLYLQNLADASTRTQLRLARLLRDREATIVESSATIPVAVRCIVAAGPDIQVAVDEGRVRDELYRRVSGLRIDVPRLRDRREDLAALANFLLREVCALRGEAPRLLSRPALSLLAALPWPGQGRELRSVLERAVASSSGPAIAMEHLLPHVRLDGGGVRQSATGTLREARERFEHEYIAAILEQHRGRVTEAARVLGIQRTNLYRKIRTLNVVRGHRRSVPTSARSL